MTIITDSLGFRLDPISLPPGTRCQCGAHVPVGAAVHMAWLSRHVEACPACDHELAAMAGAPPPAERAAPPATSSSPHARSRAHGAPADPSPSPELDLPPEPHEVEAMRAAIVERLGWGGDPHQEPAVRPVPPRPPERPRSAAEQEQDDEKMRAAIVAHLGWAPRAQRQSTREF